jgi:hypothetical protein
MSRCGFNSAYPLTSSSPTRDGRLDSQSLSRSSIHAASEPIWVLKKLAKLADICNFEVKLMGQT